ncbi:sensor histidine kinase [Actinocatenispora rupis]|uniref:Signal transduction histidine-protein kinase/phosphatase MprB n=1 Tax=Actinocatenispora rupis TaxID=519421 RepID=A0A8J3JD48_9ACTN|nr:HAMP domain-containing sensor histidine kinase [Actinocatenispora rupis]GID13783.1 two-component sensor histidine kinase [Actinocatenispora rupis]
MRRRFVLVSLVVTGVVVGAFAAPLAWMVHQFAYDRALSAAEREVVAMTTVLAVTGDAGEIRRAVGSTRAGRADRLTVHLPDGSEVGNDAGWEVDAECARAGRTGQAATVRVAGGVVHLHPTRTVTGDVAVIEILVPDALLTRGVPTAWAGLAAVSLLLLAGSALLADRLAAGAVRATRDLAGAAGRLGDGDLTVRVRPDGPPEIASVGAAFNALAGRFAALLANERELVADLSHRLRTPLTALRLGVDALPDGTDRDRLATATANVEREVDTIIRRAREPLGTTPAGHCDLRSVVSERVAFWAALAEDQGRDWAMSPARRPVIVGVPADDLESALDSVLGNIFRHTPEGTKFAVRVVAEATEARVTVDDAGPGIPEIGPRGSSASSTGLGLSIAHRVTGAAGGHLTVESSPLGGARVTLTFARTTGRPD